MNNSAERGCVFLPGYGPPGGKDAKEPPVGIDDRPSSVFALHDRENCLTADGPKRPHEAAKNVGIVAGIELFSNCFCQ